MRMKQWENIPELAALLYIGEYHDLYLIFIHQLLGLPSYNQSTPIHLRTFACETKFITGLTEATWSRMMEQKMNVVWFWDSSGTLPTALDFPLAELRPGLQIQMLTMMISSTCYSPWRWLKEKGEWPLTWNGNWQDLWRTRASPPQIPGQARAYPLSGLKCM